MTLDAPEAHTKHELLELVAKVLGKIALVDVLKVPGVSLDAAVQEGPFDFGALYVPGKTFALQSLRGRDFPGELRGSVSQAFELRGSVSQAFGTLDRLEDCRRSGQPLVLMNEDTQAGHSGGIDEALGAECALVIPLLNDPEDCPVLLLAAILHDGTGDGLCLCPCCPKTSRGATSPTTPTTPPASWRRPSGR